MKISVEDKISGKLIKLEVKGHHKFERIIEIIVKNMDISDDHQIYGLFYNDVMISNSISVEEAVSRHGLKENASLKLSKRALQNINVLDILTGKKLSTNIDMGFVVGRYLERTLKLFNIDKTTISDYYFTFNENKLPDLMTFEEVMSKFHLNEGDTLILNCHLNLNIFVFIIMPFNDRTLAKNYVEYIKIPLEKKGFSVKRGDDFNESHNIFEAIKKAITEANIIITDLSGDNPNVFYELGIAHQQEKYVIQVCQSDNEVPFDVSHLRTIFYKNSPDGFTKLFDQILNYMIEYFNKKNIRCRAFEQDDSIDLELKEFRILKKNEDKKDFKTSESLFCLVHRGEIASGPIYICPECQSIYCSRCAKVLKEKGEKCWYCGCEIKIELIEHP